MRPAIQLRLAVYLAVLLGVLGWMHVRTRAPAPIDIVVGEGRIMVSGEPLTLDALASHVSHARQHDPRRQVRISVDARAPSMVLIPVLETLQRSGIGLDEIQVVADP
ncbi:Biopolymer transport protein ExbD/TolR [Fontimonas thermophila]|uniref:Biopolymer transport protein ExbD/TolR n=1 Tax=Fontimonas thermophila TaxID=1076937 RepID=A0A1I2JJH9_9GAMM|nr:biopolymer transporter ExbD [Fontimonas thermophila]SFF54409.1 Biopolymer transport protein ExbD/TolR [Fontimonas thermophila]